MGIKNSYAVFYKKKSFLAFFLTHLTLSLGFFYTPPYASMGQGEGARVTLKILVILLKSRFPYPYLLRLQPNHPPNCGSLYASAPPMGGGSFSKQRVDYFEP